MPDVMLAARLHSARAPLSRAVSARLPLAEANRALEMLGSGEGGPLRLVIMPLGGSVDVGR